MTLLYAMPILLTFLLVYHDCAYKQQMILQTSILRFSGRPPRPLNCSTIYNFFVIVGLVIKLKASDCANIAGS